MNNKYGLQLRKKPPAAAPSGRPPRPPVLSSVFGGDVDDDDDDGVEREISRQAAKNKADKKVEEQHKKALEEDPSVFDYDGVYEEMKEQIARPKHQDKTERKSKYIERLMDKAKVREREQNIIYERKLLKERSKEDHLFADKEKFVTPAYRKKLEEEARWLEEERQRQILEEMEDVTKKKDLSDFYFGLDKNVAFGAHLEDKTRPTRKDERKDKTEAELPLNDPVESRSPESHRSPDSSQGKDRSGDKPGSSSEQNQSTSAAENLVAKDSSSDANNTDEASAEPDTQMSEERFKRSQDAVAAARERFLARKKARVQ